ncbi:AfsA-related hotdog domain-containing protein [Gilvimarinus sp. SDUM040013]|uniref:AfsA-related hotdog domain-containing protein n=1 Tax=Gilvimarinus gilvus TaxID=3058038 RepID=A0ABU4S3E0_9GAMM|nr:AfsA-related hotdog domain-containing protein [Gilvimarinus sp. SDUM040013]MDO3384426.1 AfsA-related hotdog domain-containing protein [Gilvimarinus sp. SDUM040013]MDX6851031.1 AfsA-related hotdog domain-containing protein [Gilvimarinus sp. SDUM040013]
MSNRIILVVGNKFASYALGKDAITVSQLKGLLSLPVQMLPNQGKTTLLPGQGMGEQCIADLLKEAENSPNYKMFDFSLWRNLPKRAGQNISHKHKPENTLISHPRQISQDIFELQLLIDENCELMSDHQSGQHVQGMILIEAVRQATVAITETYFLKGSTTQYAFVLNDMSVKYNNFSFPVTASITCRITEKDIDNPKRLSFAIEADVVQCNTCVSSLCFNISAIDKLRIDRQEELQATKAQKRYLAHAYSDYANTTSTQIAS